MVKESDVIIYTSPMCGACRSIEEYLDAHGVEFVNVDVSKDKEVLQALIEKTGAMTTPVVEIDGEVVMGFNKPKIDQLLNLGR